MVHGTYLWYPPIWSRTILSKDFDKPFCLSQSCMSALDRSFPQGPAAMLQSGAAVSKSAAPAQSSPQPQAAAPTTASSPGVASGMVDRCTRVYLPHANQAALAVGSPDRTDTIRVLAIIYFAGPLQIRTCLQGLRTGHCISSGVRHRPDSFSFGLGYG